MTEIGIPLNEEELERLEAFLLDRIDEDEDTEGKDEGIFNMSMLDGYFTAIVSGPNIIQPSRWLPVVWGDFEPVLDDEKEFEKILTLMIRHMNGIGATLMESPDTFEPLFLYREVGGKTHRIVDDWCEGYLRGITLDSEGWSKMEGFSHLFGLMALFSTDEGDEQLRNRSEEEVERLQDAITPAIRRAHAYWLERRGNEPTMRRNESKVGRNDPCPCGSGRKFKKCCGAPPTIH